MPPAPKWRSSTAAWSHVRDAGHPRGTTVETRDLFGEVPARRKFLRADSTETGHVAETVSLLAIAHPERGFWLKSGGRPLIEAPPVDALGPRLYQLYGGRLLEDLVEVEGGEDWARVSGLVSRPDGQRARPAEPAPVRERPARARSRPREGGERGLPSGGGGRPGLRRVPSARGAEPSRRRQRAPGEDRGSLRRSADGLDGGGTSHERGPGPRRAASAPVAVLDAAGGGPALRPRPTSSGREARARQGRVDYGLEPDAGPQQVAEAGRRDRPGRLRPGRPSCGCSVSTGTPTSWPRDGEELVLVDQHTAHERVRFEQLLSRVERRTAESQLLLAPAVWPLAPELLPAARRARGGPGGRSATTWRPSAAAPCGCGRFPRSSARAIRDRPWSACSATCATARGRSGWWPGTKDRLAATLACHSAVRAGQALSVESMTGITRELRADASPDPLPAREADHREASPGRRQPLVRSRGLEAAVKRRGLALVLPGPNPPGDRPPGGPGGGHRVLRDPEHDRHAAHDAGRRAHLPARLVARAQGPARVRLEPSRGPRSA